MGGFFNESFEEYDVDLLRSIFHRMNNDMKCNKWSFQCDNFFCISNVLVCNGQKDCLDGEDELNCRSIFYFNCNDSSSIPIQYVCNKINDCSKGEDEQFCGKIDFCAFYK